MFGTSATAPVSGIDDAGHSHHDAARATEIEPLACGKPDRNLVDLTQDMRPAPPVGRLGDFADRPANQIGDDERNLRRRQGRRRRTDAESLTTS